MAKSDVQDSAIVGSARQSTQVAGRRSLCRLAGHRVRGGLFARAL